MPPSRSLSCRPVGFFDRARSLLEFPIDEEVRERIERLELPWTPIGTDPYGVSKWHLAVAFSLLKPLYRHYFRTEVRGLQHVPPSGRVLLIGNHSGGVALDGAMTIGACFFEMSPPRLAQSMAHKFINATPGASLWANRLGQFPGLPEHAIRLLEDERMLLVFPEGARGTAKLFPERYDLLEFGHGFMRLALRTKTPIVPFAFLGAGEAIPTVRNLTTVGKLLGVPYVPITPYLLPLPLPVAVDLDFSEAMRFEGTGNEDDVVVQGYVDQVRDRIRGLIDAGYRRRRGLPDSMLVGASEAARGGH